MLGGHKMKSLFITPLVLMSMVLFSNIANAKELNYCSDQQIERCVDGLPFHATAERIFLGENIVRHCDMDKKIIIYDQFINLDKTRSPNFASGNISRFSAAWRRDIYSSFI